MQITYSNKQMITFPNDNNHLQVFFSQFLFAKEVEFRIIFLPLCMVELKLKWEKNVVSFSNMEKTN